MTSALLLLSFSLAIGSQATPPATNPRPAAQTAARPGSIELVVSTGMGGHISAATITAEGPVSRHGTTGADGSITLQNVTAGTYRVRIERSGYITLEKEIVVRANARTRAEAVLSTAPAATSPPPAPPPPPPAGTPVLTPGEPKVVSLVDDLAEQLIRDAAPIAERALGCSGATAAKLIRLRDPLTAHVHNDADELIYVLAGDATLKLGDATHTIAPGWLGVVPRGMSHSVTRQGRRDLLMLSVTSGPPCSAK
jgi:mannose-6-phosphate isomerase-like protein (cupin superfamily)